MALFLHPQYDRERSVSSSVLCGGRHCWNPREIKSNPSSLGVALGAANGLTNTLLLVRCVCCPFSSIKFLESHHRKLSASLMTEILHTLPARCQKQASLQPPYKTMIPCSQSKAEWQQSMESQHDKLDVPATPTQISSAEGTPSFLRARFNANICAQFSARGVWPNGCFSRCFSGVRNNGFQSLLWLRCFTDTWLFFFLSVKRFQCLGTNILNNEHSECKTCST